MTAIQSIEALVDLGLQLRAAGYHFVTPTPRTHRIVVTRRNGAPARDLRDVFGWSLPFEPDLLPDRMLTALEAAGVVSRCDGLCRSAVRFSSLGAELVAHSAFPTSAEDAVFFGPDTYRFARLIRETLAIRVEGARVLRALDLCCGSGAGGLVLADLLPAHTELTLSDVNEHALRFAAANFRLAGRAEPLLRRSDLYADIGDGFDLVVANPPYLNDLAGRAYRHGGGIHGEALSLRIVKETLPRLAPGGWLLLYTGVAVVDGEDAIQRCAAKLAGMGVDVASDEIDVDVFAEELEGSAYADAERIAVRSLLLRRAE